jgi:predicted GTPase
MMSINEKILNDFFDLYADPHCGLVKIASQVGIKLKLPHRKVNILLIGNHSAGKSSFINWYIDGT